ncbi:MAG: ATP-binding protein [Alphaproteobacteria bacterium]
MLDGGAASSAAPASDGLDAKIRDIRSRFVNGTLVVLSMAAVPALVASLMRIPDIGFLPAMGAHVALAAALFALTLRRHRLPYFVRAGYVVLLFFMIAAVGLANIGMIGGPYIHFAAAVIFAFVLFGMWTGAAMIVLSIAAMLGFYELSAAGILAPATDPVAYIASRSTWITAAAGLLLLTAGVGAAITLYQRQLANTLRGEADERRRLDHLIAYAPDGILIANAAGTIVRANIAAASAFGYAEEDLVGMPLETLLPAVKSVWPSADGDRAPARSDIPSMAGRRRDDTDFPVAVTLGRLADAHGDSVVAMVHDLTDFETLQERLVQTAKLEAMGNLTGGMAHDFNNFLTIIIGSLDFLQGDVEGVTDSQRHIERARRAADRAANLTKSLLAFARQQPLVPQAIDIAAHVDDTLSLLRPGISPNIQIAVDFPSDLWRVQVDASQFDSAIVNIATNALDAMPNGGTFRVVGRNTVEEGQPDDPGALNGDFVAIDLIDSGIGMSADVAASAFQPFFSTKDAGHGTGLGLSMVHGFISQSEGRAEIDSTPGAGTTVRLYLPRAVDDADSDGQDAAAVESAPPTPGARALVVEDDENVREVAAAHLWALGYDVIESASGDLAWPLIADPDVAIDVLFTDIVMDGELDGIALAERARLRRPALPIVLTSGYAGGSRSEQSDILRGTPLLQKPYRRVELAAAIAEATSRAGG